MTKQAETPLPFRGWRKGRIPVTHAPEGQATIAEMKGRLLGSLDVHGLVDTPERLERGGWVGSGSYIRGRFRFLVPKEYTHLLVENSSNELPFFRWKAGFLTSEDCRELTGTVTGGCPDVLRHHGPATTALLEVGSGYAHVRHTRPDAAPEDRHHDIINFSKGPFRGRVEIPGPGLILIDTLVRWKLTVSSSPSA
ncbi:hypothetical protein [Actinocorallia libanotica]|uniref:Scramblase n=1 Tax=Actinocorallia libanotica TaxID=46162 RepID=A0ABN1R939_9ACTN